MKTYDEVVVGVLEGAANHRRKVKRIQKFASITAMCAVCIAGLSVYLNPEPPQSLPADSMPELITQTEPYVEHSPSSEGSILQEQEDTAQPPSPSSEAIDATMTDTQFYILSSDLPETQVILPPTEPLESSPMESLTDPPETHPVVDPTEPPRNPPTDPPFTTTSTTTTAASRTTTTVVKTQSDTPVSGNVPKLPGFCYHIDLPHCRLLDDE